MKESEAKEKVCPINLIIMSNIQIAAIGDKDTIDGAKPIGFCTGSYCMMWTGSDCGLKPKD